MAVDSFLRTFQESLANKKIVNPLTSSNTAIANPKLQVKNPNRSIAPTPTYGSNVPDWLTTKKSGAIDTYMAAKSKRTSDIASDYADKAAGQVPVNEWGIVQDKMTNFADLFNSQLSTIGNRGKAALATEEAKAQWQSLQSMQEANAGYNINWTPGASTDGSNVGAKAVNLAMSAFNSKTPYVWGGNSLSGGVDCSGLVQQVYKKLGINVPRTTYEQAKSGKQVPLNSLLPGDLVFYNSGSSDPNGIGKLSHVGIYIGNGQIVDARNSKSGIKVGSMNIMGGPAMAVRPW